MNKKFLKKFTLTVIIFSISMIVAGQLSHAQSIQKKSGLNFQVPDDWPIEKRGGILAPIPTDEYMMIKFKEVEEEFKMVNDGLASKFEELQASMKNMEANFTEEIQKVQERSESQAKEGGDDLTDILESVTLLKNEVDYLDRKLMNKVSAMKNRVEDDAGMTKSLEQKIENLQTQSYKLDEEVDYIMDK